VPGAESAALRVATLFAAPQATLLFQRVRFPIDIEEFTRVPKGPFMLFGKTVDIFLEKSLRAFSESTLNSSS